MKSMKSKIIIICVSVVVIGMILTYVFTQKKSVLDVNISNVKVDVKIERFDKEIFTEHETVEQLVGYLDSVYPDFFSLYTQQIIKIGHIGYHQFYEYFDAFLQDYSVEQAHLMVEKEYSNINDVENVLIDGFKHLKYYYPEKETPRVISFIAGFNQSIITDENLIGIGLDKYLGADCELYAMMQVPSFAAKNMRREMIPIDCMRGWISMEAPNTDTTGYLMAQMIYEGKIVYFIDAMFPSMPDSLKMGYSAREMSYCEHFEKNIWDYFISEKLLFSTDYLEQRKFIGDAPFTAAFGKEAPGRVAIWTGWQIVKAYAKENEVSLTELMKEQDYQKILNNSYYEPE